MKKSRMSVFGTAVISAVAIGTVAFVAGCETQQVLRNRPFVPAPANDPTAAPAVVQPAAPAPVTVQPAPAPEVKVAPEKPVIIPAPEVVPK